MRFWEQARSVAELIRRQTQQQDAAQQTAAVVVRDTALAGGFPLPGLSDVRPILLSTRGRYLFTLTQPPWADFDLAVLNGQGTLIAADTSSTNPSQILIEGRGLCFAAMHAAAGSGPYTLSIHAI